MIFTIITFIIVLGVLILVHEWGHFTAAKMMKIRVDEFGFGLPPRAIGKKIGETIYSLNWLPIGGFVRMYGEDEHHPEKVKKELHRAFFSKKPWQRAIVLVAGVVMNFILGWFILSYLLTQGVLVPGEIVHVVEIADNSPAQIAGLSPDDVIVSVMTQDGADHVIDNSTRLQAVTKDHLDEELILTIERDSKVLEVAVRPRTDTPVDEGPIGVVISDLKEIRYPWHQAPIEGFKRSVEMMGAIVTGFATIIGRAITLQPIKADIAGPVGIVKLVGEASEFGINAVLSLTALLSFNLALINILPFPALDGGRLVFVIVEAITGRRVKPRWETNAHQIGMALLLLLLLLITINDVLRLTTG